MAAQQLVDVPVDGEKLHMRADGRNNLSTPQEPKISLLERRETRGWYHAHISLHSHFWYWKDMPVSVIKSIHLCLSDWLEARVCVSDQGGTLLQHLEKIGCAYEEVDSQSVVISGNLLVWA